MSFTAIDRQALRSVIDEVRHPRKTTVSAIIKFDTAGFEAHTIPNEVHESMEELVLERSYEEYKLATSKNRWTIAILQSWLSRPSKPLSDNGFFIRMSTAAHDQSHKQTMHNENWWVKDLSKAVALLHRLQEQQRAHFCKSGFVKLKPQE